MTNSVAKLKEELKGILDGLDVIILERAMEWARQVYRSVVEEIDNLLLRCRDKALSVQHIRQVWYSTVMGRVRIGRRQYKDKKGKYRYLLDEVLGTEGNSHTTAKVKHLALGMACDMSFRRSSRLLEQTTAIHLSHQAIWGLVGRVADPYLEQGRREIEWFLETGELPSSEGKKVAGLMIEADGVMVSLQREKSRKAEVKLGIAYEGWSQVGKDRYATVNKTIYSDVAGGEEYWAGMMLKLQRKYDLGDTRRVVIGGDGASWVKDGLEHFGGTYQLCRYHLNRQLTAALGPDRKTAKAVKDYCEMGEVDLACQMLSEAKVSTKGEQFKRIENVCRYLMANSDGLRDYRLDLGDEGTKLRRTGAIEGNIDKLVVRRMKNQGMSWRVEGIRRMLCVRFLYLENKLEASLRKDSLKPEMPSLPMRKVRRLVKEANLPHLGVLKGALPSLYGPHVNRPWVQALKSFAKLDMGK